MTRKSLLLAYKLVVMAIHLPSVARAAWTFPSPTVSSSLVRISTSSSRRRQFNNPERRQRRSTTTFSLSSFATDQPPKTSSSSSSLTFPVGSTIELVDPVTGCQVVLLGCFHGSQSSALDVKACLSQPLLVQQPTSCSNKNHQVEQQQQVVALELCATRFDDLRKDVEKERQRYSSNGNESLQQRPWLVRFIRMVRKTIRQRGWSTGMAAALLGGVSGFQTTLSGLEPGLEYRTALEYVLDHSNHSNKNIHGNHHDRDCYPIVLADQNVDETLAKMGQLPAVSIALWKQFLFSGGNWDATFGVEAAALARAVGLGRNSGDDDNNNDHDNNVLTMLGFMSRSPYAIRDMARMMVPPLLALQGILVASNAAFEWLYQQEQPSEWIMDAAAAAATSTADVVSMTSQHVAAAGPLAAWWVVASNAAIITVGYLSVALPAVQIILRERDIVLTQGIQQACQLATNQGTQPGRVVAVLGLLHVNGVAQQLLLQSRHSLSPPPLGSNASGKVEESTIS